MKIYPYAPLYSSMGYTGVYMFLFSLCDVNIDSSLILRYKIIKQGFVLVFALRIGCGYSLDPFQ